MVVGVLYECIKRQDNSGTTIVICPDLYPDDFNEYLNVVNVLDQVLDDYDLKDDLQVKKKSWIDDIIAFYYHYIGESHFVLVGIL